MCEAGRQGKLARLGWLWGASFFQCLCDWELTILGGLVVELRRGRCNNWRERINWICYVFRNKKSKLYIEILVQLCGVMMILGGASKLLKAD